MHRNVATNQAKNDNKTKKCTHRAGTQYKVYGLQRRRERKRETTIRQMAHHSVTVVVVVVVEGSTKCNSKGRRRAKKDRDEAMR